jgi:hypothetical protein
MAMHGARRRRAARAAARRAKTECAALPYSHARGGGNVAGVNPLRAATHLLDSGPPTPLPRGGRLPAFARPDLSARRAGMLLSAAKPREHAAAVARKLTNSGTAPGPPAGALRAGGGVAAAEPAAARRVAASLARSHAGALVSAADLEPPPGLRRPTLSPSAQLAAPLSAHAHAGALASVRRLVAVGRGGDGRATTADLAALAASIAFRVGVHDAETRPRAAKYLFALSSTRRLAPPQAAAGATSLMQGRVAAAARRSSHAATTSAAAAPLPTPDADHAAGSGAMDELANGDVAALNSDDDGATAVAGASAADDNMRARLAMPASISAVGGSRRPLTAPADAVSPAVARLASARARLASALELQSSRQVAADGGGGGGAAAAATRAAASP